MFRPICILLLLTCLTAVSLGENVRHASFRTGHQAGSALKLRHSRVPDYITKLAQFDFTDEEIDGFISELEAQSGVFISSECAADTANFMVDFNNGENYTLQVLDSIGKPPANLQGFDFVWLGAYDECKHVHVASIADGTRSFSGQYCLTTIPPIQLALCVSHRCSEEDVSAVVKSILSPLSDVTYQTECAVKRGWPVGDIVALIIVICLLIMAAIGTTMDVYLWTQKPKKKKEGKPDDSPPPERKQRERKPSIQLNGTTATLESANENQELPPSLSAAILLSLPDQKLRDSDGRALSLTPSIAPSMSSLPSVMDADENIQQHKPVEPEPKYVPELNMAWKIGLTFSWFTSGRKILDATKRKGVINCLNGLRVISLLWVILGHTYYFTWNFQTEPLKMFDQAMELSYQPVFNATVSVDTFFFISGLLTTYLTLKHLRKTRGRLNWGLFYFHRFWRLTPVYMFVIMFFCTLFLHLPEGPNMRRLDGIPALVNCQKYWWANLLYINNFVPLDYPEQCLGWSWYLANDMQFYLISPIFLYLLYRNWKIGIAVVTALLVASVTITGAMARHWDVMATRTPWNPQTPYYDYLYVQPQYRIPSYLIGVLTAYLLYRYKGKVVMPKWLVVGGWILAALCNLSVLYGLTYWQGQEGVLMPYDLSAFYICCHRFVWAIGCAWVVIACVSGYGGPVEGFLSWAGWIPLVRLSYCAYLLHPLAFFLYSVDSRQRIYNHPTSMIALFAGVAGLTFALSLPFTLLVESPMMGLEKLMLPTGKASKPKKKRRRESRPSIVVEMDPKYDNKAFSGDVTEKEGGFDVPNGHIKFVVDPPPHPAVAKLNPALYESALRVRMLDGRPRKSDVSIRSEYTDDEMDEDDLDEAATYDPKTKIKKIKTSDGHAIDIPIEIEDENAEPDLILDAITVPREDHDDSEKDADSKHSTSYPEAAGKGAGSAQDQTEETATPL